MATRQPMTWPQLVIAVRGAYNLTVAQLGHVMAVTRNAVYTWENGTAMPGPFQRTALARMWEATRDPAAFHQTFNAIMQALPLEAAVAEELPQEAHDAAVGKGLLAGVGLAVLLGALFSGNEATKKKVKRRKA